MIWDKTPIPPRIENKIAGLSWSADTIGMSGSTILLSNDMVLKIEKVNRSSENEKKLLAWLDRKLPVPKIIEEAIQDEYSFLLMSRLPGEMSCSDNNIKNISETVSALALGLKKLWQIDITNCPYRNDTAEKLAQAKFNIENDLVDTDDFNPETFGPAGFKDIDGLYNFLVHNRPEEDFVFSHGDFCLPNVFIKGREVTGFLDWGSAGIADKWQDIALCVRSLRYNYLDYPGYTEADFEYYKKQLFNELGMEPDEEKIRYYILLDELF